MELDTAKSTDTTDLNVEVTSRSEEESLLNDRARAAVYWPGITSDVYNKRAGCKVYE